MFVSEDKAKDSEIIEILSTPNDEISIWLASINRSFTQYKSVFAGFGINKVAELERIRNESEIENKITHPKHRKEIMNAIERLRGVSVSFFVYVLGI